MHIKTGKTLEGFNNLKLALLIDFSKFEKGINEENYGLVSSLSVRMNSQISAIIIARDAKFGIVYTVHETQRMII